MYNLSRRQFIQQSAMGLGAIGIAGTSPTLSAQSSRGIKGVSAPELRIGQWINGDGKTQDAFSVAAHKGKWIYLKCFQEWCPACHSVSFPNLQKLVSAFPNNDLIVPVAIQTTFEGFSSNTSDALRKNQLRYELNIPFGHDPGNVDLPRDNPARYPTTMQSYRTGGTPWIIVIDPDGMVVFNDFHIDMDKLINFLHTQSV
ncbi:peroxiredoxin family protein [Eionea flava]